jgi:parvulin-like peptidyl-prolyl isomerase
MNSEFNNDVVEEPRDRTWLVWAGFAAVIVIMIVAMALQNRQDSNRSVVRARHILIMFNKADPIEKERALKQITELRERIEDGESFAKLASDYSQDPYSARRGGDLNYAERGVYASEFEAYVWSAPIGELSQVIESSHGYHLVRVEDRIVSDVDRVIMEQERAVREELKQDQSGGGEDAPSP